MAELAPVNPDCLNGKHHACRGDAWDHLTDTLADCTCDCHEDGAE